ncbi:hypothetical protein KAS08_05525 [Candidatus Pacearchaeota archaeon]|nr:hypothetical protein [Candidatus Pacearchaeota archaeon]
MKKMEKGKNIMEVLKKLNWDRIEFWIMLLIVFTFIGYLIFSGGAWK